jgi:rifampicin phosphotransferase
VDEKRSGDEACAGMFADIADDARLGGKARSLARLRAAGLPTPAGFVVTDALFRALLVMGGPLPAATRLDAAVFEHLAALSQHLEAAAFPPGFLAALARRLAALGGPRFSVRSSFAGEDRPGALAAGVYESRTDVRAEDVPAALRVVLRSALGAGAAAYAVARGHGPGQPPVAVLIHRYIAGDAWGGAAWDPARGEPPLIDAVVRAGAAGGGSRTGDEGGAPRRGQVPAATAGVIREALAALAAREGPVEIEWVATADAVTFLQARPYAAPPPPAPWRGWRDLPPGEAGAPAERWRWDAAHNPLPLSEAHAGLVAAVDERCHIGIRQRVLGGYLFYAGGGPTPPATLAPGEVAAALAALAGDVEAHLRALGTAPSLEEALAGFFPLYERLFGVIQPAARAARERLRALLAPAPAALAQLPRLLAGVGSRAGERLRLAVALRQARPGDERDQARAAYLAAFGDEAPVWDIAVPTNREAPGRLLEGALGGAAAGAPATAPDHQVALQAARSALLAAPSTLQAPAALAPAALAPAALQAASRDQPEAAGALVAARDQLEAAGALVAAVAEARAAAAAGEEDDWLYARLQAPIRHAVLALGQRLAAAGALPRAADVFHLPLPWLRAYARGEAPAGDAAALAAAGHARLQAALADPPPLVAPGPAVAGNAAHAVVRGAGTGGRAAGRAHIHHGPAAGAPPADAILIARTLLPTELPLLQVAALVTETGGLLDHVATQARERGLPAVVGAAGALSLLRDGDHVVVDADQGLVVKL